MVLIQVESLDKEIEELYSTDEEFINTYHLVNPTLENCISDCKEIVKNCKERYIIQEDENIVGIFGKAILEDEEYILPFFIHPSYRNRKEEIFNLVLSKFSKPCICLSLNNKKAVKFFIFNNFSMIGMIENDGIRGCKSIVLKKR